MLEIALRRDGHKIETVNGGDAAKKKLEGAIFDVIVTDIKMPKTDGIEVLRFAHQTSPETAVIFMRSEEDTSELQSLAYLVCRLLLGKKKHTQGRLMRAV